MAPNRVTLLEGRRHRLVAGVNPADVKVLSVKDSEGDEYQDKEDELDLKAVTLSGKKIKLRYGVYGKTQKIKLWIEYEPSKIHDDFYKPTIMKFELPAVAILVDDKSKSPGEYELEWDGRDQTLDRRLLLAGKYKVKITGKCDLGKKENEVKLSIAEPNAFNYGIHYYKSSSSGRNWHSSKEGVEHAADKQVSLKDGTGYIADSNLACTAAEALSEWKEAAVVYWDGHSNPNVIAFHSSENAKYIKADSSHLCSRNINTSQPQDASFDSLGKSELEDLFLVVLCGCRTGNEIFMLQTQLQRLDPGSIDNIHGPKTTAALRWFQYYNDIKPFDGLKNEEILKRLGVPVEKKTEEEKTREVQRKLRSFYPGSEKVYGRRTKRAVTNFQQVHGIEPADGKLNDKTLDRLAIDKEGKTDKEITREAQEVLRSFYPGSLNGKLNNQTREAIKNYQLRSFFKLTGEPDEKTLKELKIDEYANTREVQKKLKSYSYAGKLDGKMGDKTRTAIQNYQRDNLSYYGAGKGLEVNGKADEATLEALKIGPKTFYTTNIASNVTEYGADFALGFIYKIGFETSKKWSIKFWDYLADGNSIEKSARDAKHFVDIRMKNKLNYKIYSRSGDSAEHVTLHPARYGAKSLP